MNSEKYSHRAELLTANYDSIIEHGGVVGYVQKIAEIKKSDEAVQHKYTFYLNSSDSMETLAKQKCEGKSIMTVAGSGEFTHTFINGGAKEVTMFDISPSAAFFGELRHQALCNLDMQTYIKLFEPFTIKPNNDEDITSIIRFEIYRQIREHLTRDAREYFDTVENNPAVANIERFTWSGFARMRTNSKYKFNRLVGEIIASESEYLQLQEKAKKTKVHMSLVDVSNLDYLVATKKPDILYISNIAYFPERTLAIAKKYIDLGVKEVICSVASNSEDFAGDYDSKLRNRTFAINGEPLMVGSKFAYELYKPNSFDAIPVSIEVLGLDRNADYGITLKATK